MNKLGFAIKLASQGAGNAIECNKSQWTNKVVDIREYLKLFNGLQGTDNVVTFMSFDEEGCFITLLRAISGRVGDFLSGWIYIPNTIEISGIEVINVYKFVLNILSQSNLNDCKDNILSFFSKEYSNKAYTVKYIPTSGDLFGVRFIGYYNLTEIFDSNRYQPYYSKYKAIFLLDQDNEVSIANEYKVKFNDLSKLPIEQTCLLKVPTSQELLALGRGVKLFFPNNVEFRDSILQKRGEKIQLYAVREGFEPSKLPAFEMESDIQCLPETSTLQVVWKKKISSSMFNVCNSKYEPIEKGVSVTVNGQDITFNEILVSEDECRDAIVKVSAADFETSETRENILRSEIPITLKRKNKTFHSRIELANGREAEITIESKYIESSDKSPLKAYDFEYESRGENCLRISSGFIWKQRLYGFLTALVVGLTVVAIAFYLGLLPSENATEVVEDPTTQTPESGGGVVSFSMGNAIKYLDENPIWDKNEMEKHPDLKGLFDDLNEFELRTIIDEWSGKLADSENMLKIIEVSKKNSEKGWDPKQKEHKPTYNNDKDTQINVSNYINWLDKDQSKAETPRVRPQTSSTGASSKGKETKQSGSAAQKPADVKEQDKW